MSQYSGLDETSLRALLDVAASYDERRNIRAALRDVKKGTSRPIDVGVTSGDNRRKSVSRSMTITAPPSSITSRRQSNTHLAGERRPSILDRSSSFAERRTSITDRRGSIHDRRPSIVDKRASVDKGRRGSIYTQDNASEMKETIRRNSVLNQYEGISDEAVLGRLPPDPFKSRNEVCFQAISINLKEATELDERMKIRAAMRKLRDVKLNDSTPAEAVVLQQDAQNRLPSKDKHIGRSHSVKARDHYTQIKDEKVLENLLNSTNDYFERKKIRAALTQLRQAGKETHDEPDEPANHGEIRVPPTETSRVTVTLKADDKVAEQPPVFASQHTIPAPARATINLKRTQSLKLSSFGRRTPLDIISQAIARAANGGINGSIAEISSKGVIPEETCTIASHKPIVMEAKDLPPQNAHSDSAEQNLGKEPGTQGTTNGANDTASNCNASKCTTTVSTSAEFKWDISNYDQDDGEEEEVEESGADDDGVTYLEDVQNRVKEIENKIDACKSFDERRELRANVRELRAQIREGKYSPRPLNMPKKNKSTSETGSKSVQRPKLQQQESVDLSKPVTEGESKSYQMQRDIPIDGGGIRRVKMSVVKTRTPSQSDYCEKDTVIETEIPSAGGTTFIEQNKTVTKTKLSKRGSDYYERAQNTTRKVESASGTQVLETEVAVEKDSSSVSQGKQQSEVAEMKFVAIDNTVKLTTIVDKSEDEGDSKTNGLIIEESFTSSEESDDCFDGAEITRPLSDASTLDGTSATFECGVRLGQGSVAWYHEDKVLPHSDEFQQLFDGSTARLVITEVFPEDAGQYRCVVRSRDTEADTTAKLTIKPNAELVAPVFSKPLTDQQALDGDQVVLECAVTGKPVPNVTWFRENCQLHMCGDFQQTYDAETGVAILSISEVFPDDAGLYACVAKSAGGEGRSQCTVTVAALPPKKLEPPTFKRSFGEHEVKDGDKVVLECEMGGSKPLEISWYHNGARISRSPEFRQSCDGRIARLVIEAVFPEDSGSYKCHAKNAAGTDETTGQLIVLEKDVPEIITGPPCFLRGLRNQTALDGECATLECQVIGDPQPMIIWYKNGKILRAGVEFRQSYDGLVAKLEITEIFPDDQGTYECVARNEHGKEKSKAKVVVKDKNDVSSYDDTDETGSQVSSVIDTMSDKNLDSIEDEDELHKMLNATEDFEERKKIRARLRELGKQQSAAYEARKSQMPSAREDPVAMRQRHADAAKAKRMQVMDDANKNMKSATSAEDYKRQKYAEAEADKQRRLADMTKLGSEMSKMYNTDTKDVLKEADDKKSEEEAVFRSTKTETGEDGSKLTTTTTTTKQSTKEGDTTVTKQTKTVTQSSGLGGTSYKVTKTSAEDTAKRLADTFTQKGIDGTSGIIKVKTESWSSKDGITNRSEKTKTWGGTGTKTTGARGARDAFKQLDKANPSEGSGKKVTIDRSPSSIKQMLLDWCARQVRDYEGVKITNFSSSWNDGMAFCALIHRFYPRCFDFKKLNPKARKANFKLGFTVAEKEGGIAPLLEVEDMVRMKNPDWKCVFTYVQMFYRKFRDWDDSLTLEENQAAVKDKF